MIHANTYTTGNGKFQMCSLGQPNKTCVNGGIAFGRKKNKIVQIPLRSKFCVS